MGSVLREIIVDCHEPLRVAEFWSQVLGWAVHADNGIYWMSESGEPFLDLLLVFLAVPETKAIKNRIHLDVSPVGGDRDEEVARLIGLGARHVDVGQGQTPWVVLADPEGNEFCVLARRADQ